MAWRPGAGFASRWSLRGIRASPPRLRVRDVLEAEVVGRFEHLAVLDWGRTATKNRIHCRFRIHVVRCVDQTRPPAASGVPLLRPIEECGATRFMRVLLTFGAVNRSAASDGSTPRPPSPAVLAFADGASYIPCAGDETCGMPSIEKRRLVAVSDGQYPDHLVDGNPQSPVTRAFVARRCSLTNASRSPTPLLIDEGTRVSSSTCSPAVVLAPALEELLRSIVLPAATRDFETRSDIGMRATAGRLPPSPRIPKG